MNNLTWERISQMNDEEAEAYEQAKSESEATKTYTILFSALSVDNPKGFPLQEVEVQAQNRENAMNKFAATHKMATIGKKSAGTKTTAGAVIWFVNES